MIFIVAAVAVVGGLARWMLIGDEVGVAIQTPADIREETSTVPDESQSKNFTNAKQHNAGGSSEVGKPRPTSGAQTNAAGFETILQSMKLDANGRVVLDASLQAALEMGFDELEQSGSPVALSQLQRSVRDRLRGQGGEEAARLLEDYYRFRSAETELYEQPVSQPAEQYEKLVQLRRSYLGAETADKFFASEEASGRHMLASYAIRMNPNLTDEQKQAQQNALQEKLSDRQLALGLTNAEEAAAEKVERLRERGASGTEIYSTRRAILGEQGARELAAADREETKWQARFNGFWQARRYVMQAGLDESERQRQIEQLIDQYFSPEERERARITSSEREARETR